eukprot:m.15415 g.15415  ORF g.15415 m.15415 type:complete len:50 (-) comp5388_c0_seq1:175-324(-)
MTAIQTGGKERVMATLVSSLPLTSNNYDEIMMTPDYPSVTAYKSNSYKK